MVTVRELIVKWGFDVDEAPIKRLDRDIKGLKKDAKRLGIVLAGAAAGVGYLLNEAGKQEQVVIAFETLIGNVEQAHKTIKDLFDFARRTPFTIPEIEKNAKLLLAYGTDANDLIKTLGALGNIASAVGKQAFPRLALALGQVRAATKLRGQELRQFTESGVDLLKLLSEQTGKTVKEMQSDVSAGAVSFEMVEKAIFKASGPGGRFFNLMIRQSKTLLGIISNLQDTMIIFSREIGMELLPAAKEIAIETLNWFDANRKLIKQRTLMYIKILAKFMKDLFGIIKNVGRVLNVFITLVGGAENAVKLLTFAFSSLLALRLFSFLGNLTLVIIDLTIAMKALGAASLVSMDMIAAIPLVVGAGVAALLIVLEDIIAFFQGRDSVFGLQVAGFKAFFDLLRQPFEDFMNFIETTYNKSVLKDIVDFFAAPSGIIAKGLGIAGDLIGFNNSANAGAIASTNNNSNAVTNVNAPINVVVPEGTDPTKVGPMVRDGVSDGLNRVLRDTLNANQPAFVQ